MFRLFRRRRDTAPDRRPLIDHAAERLPQLLKNADALAQRLIPLLSTIPQLRPYLATAAPILTIINELAKPAEVPHAITN